MDPGKSPSRVGRYEIRDELGRGMMGVVYEAWDPVLGRRVALKMVKAVAPSRSEREAWEQRFLSEARAAARLSHPCIVVVHDVGRDHESDTLFMALEYLYGESLAEKIAGGRPLPWREALRIVGRVADALHHAHAQGVVHRDVKPANIMIQPSGEPKILDFGIARIDAGSLTMPGNLFGTPLYMSPEQAAGEAVDARSDLFSLGTIAWALLTGRTPFEAASVPAILSRVMHRDPPPPSEVVPGIPPEVDRVLARATAKAPEDRYPDGRSLAEDIDDVLVGRTPRHLVDWVPPRTGERTIASDRLPADMVLAELEAEKEDASEPAAPGRRRRGRARPLLLLLVLLACGGAFFHLHPEHLAVWTALARQARDSRPGVEGRRLLASARAAWASARAPAEPIAEPVPGAQPPLAASGAPSPDASAALSERQAGAEGAVDSVEGVPPESAPVAGTAGEATAAAAAGTQAVGGPAATGLGSSDQTATPIDLAKPEPTASAPTPTPLPTPSPTPTAAPTNRSSPMPKPGVSPRAKPTAFLSVGFEHRLKGGTLEVWVDGRRVARETLDSRVTAKVLLLEVRKGSVQQTLQLEPGRHQLRVRIRSSGQTKTAETSAQFRSGATRRLEIEISRLSGKISLDWK